MHVVIVANTNCSLLLGDELGGTVAIHCNVNWGHCCHLIGFKANGQCCCGNGTMASSSMVLINVVVQSDGISKLPYNFWKYRYTKSTFCAALKYDYWVGCNNATNVN